jgi:hypothetical protein
MEGMPAWALAMQKALMKHTTDQVAGLRAEVEAAKSMALESRSEVRVLRAEWDSIKAARDENPSGLRSLQALEAEFQKLKHEVKPAAQMAPDSNKGAGKGDAQKRKRTINFGRFPEDTKAADIENFMKEVLKDVSSDVEEVFAYGKKFAERGGARFKSEAAMWDYMTAQAGAHKHEYEGSTIYCNVDTWSQDPTSEKAMKERAVRKLVRAIIETQGGNGKAVKANIDTNYNRGIVWWMDERIAEWKDDRMQFKDAGAQFRSAFDQLMAAE